MSYQIEPDYSQVLMFPPSIEDFVAPDDPVRFIRAFVDELDLKQLGFKIREQWDGRPSYSATLLLKIWLYGSYEKIHSCRGLERQCRKDLGLLWLTGMNYPDHNSLWRFWKENKGAIKKLFKQSVQIALRNNLVGMVYHAIDGTKLKAQASRFGGLNKADMKLLSVRLDEYIESMSRQIENNGAKEPDDRLPERMQDAEELRKCVKEQIAELEGKEHGTLSPVDIESRRMKMNRGNIEFGYNAQAAADDKTGIIVGASVSQAETDHHLLNSMLKEVAATTGRNATSSVADAGYFSGDELEKVAEMPGVFVNVPEEHNPRAGVKNTDTYHNNNFTYNKERDVFICPHGCELKRKRKNRDYIQYKCTCFADCQYKSHCTSSRTEKLLTVHRCHESIRSHKEKIKSDEAKALLRKRGSVIERVFGWLKEYYGLRRLMARGLSNARGIWYLACTVYNLRKIWMFTEGKPKLTY